MEIMPVGLLESLKMRLIQAYVIGNYGDMTNTYVILMF
jgi:hypothetical protein